MKAKYKHIQKNDYKVKPIMEIVDVNSNNRMCNCCNSNKGTRKEFMLGYDNYAISFCICEQCLIILNDMINECLEEGAK